MPVIAGLPGAPGRRSGTGGAGVDTRVEGEDHALCPSALTARTWNWYPLDASRPVTSRGEAALEIRVDQAEAAPLRDCTSYPVSAGTPVSDGAVQETVRRSEAEPAAAWTAVGAPGTLQGERAFTSVAGPNL